MDHNDVTLDEVLSLFHWPPMQTEDVIALESATAGGLELLFTWRERDRFNELLIMLGEACGAFDLAFKELRHSAGPGNRLGRSELLTLRGHLSVAAQVRSELRDLIVSAYLRKEKNAGCHSELHLRAGVACSIECDQERECTVLTSLLVATVLAFRAAQHKLTLRFVQLKRVTECDRQEVRQLRQKGALTFLTQRLPTRLFTRKYQLGFA